MTLLSSTFAVQGFFVISGLLILQSFDRSRPLGSYISKRIRRIYPAYLLVVLGCAVMGLLVSTYSPTQYFGFGWLRYVGANPAFLNFIQPSLPGVFVTNPLVPAVNGALWTLKIEVAFYVAVPIIAWLLRRWDWRIVLTLLFFLSVAYTRACIVLAESTGKPGLLELVKQLPGQLTFFCVGMAAYMVAKSRPLPIVPIFVGAFVAYGLSLVLFEDIFRPLAIGGFVIAAGYGFRLGSFAKFGDFSYGIYILHFPILQTLIHFGAFYGEPLLIVLTGYILALTGSILLWHLVEKHFLKRGNHYGGEAVITLNSRVNGVS